MSNSVSLTDSQKEAIEETKHHLQIIACAGSGKTEVITRRIAGILKDRPDIRPENIVAFTFTEKAAASMKVRIKKALDGCDSPDFGNMYIGTIHAYCNSLLKRCTRQFQNFTILDTVKIHHFVTRYCGDCGMADLGLKPTPRNVNLFLQCIEKMIDDYDRSDTWTPEQRSVLKKYTDCMYSHGYLDFSLIIFETLRQIRENPAVAESLGTIRYLVVDEYQDVDDLQERLIQCIARAGANICVVGDDDQTIYQFRGSNADNMISFSRRYPNVHQVRMETNFRCAPGIVDVADCVIRHNQRRLDKKMISGQKQETAHIQALRFDSKEEQFAGIAKQIAQLHQQGIPYREMAVLVRKGKAINSISSALAAQGIAFETDSAEHFFTGNYFGRFVTTLQILSDRDKAKLYDRWKELADRPTFNSGFKYLRSCAQGGSLRLSEIIRGFCEKIQFLDGSAEDFSVRINDLEGISKILDDYDEIYGDWQLSARVAGILKFLGTQAAEEYKYHSFRPKDPTQDAVQIMTVHKSKGLEFHTVFLPELTKREFPVSNMGGKKYWHILGGVFEENKSKYQSDLEDERKLFYVAVTRAKQNLYMSYELSAQPVSVFVEESAESPYLHINRGDLTYNPKQSAPAFIDLSDDTPEDREEQRRQQQEYWAAVGYAREQLYNYYGTGAHFCPAMGSMLGKIKNMTPDQILEEAGACCLI